jgi:hypothetical protein
MEYEYPSTMTVEKRAGASKACSPASLSLLIVHDELQPLRAVAGFPLRVMPQTRFQFAGADAPRQRPVRSSSSRRIGQPIHAVRLQAGFALTIGNQPRSQFVADLHHLNRLSCSPSPDGFKTIGKALIYEAEPLSSDDKIYD